MRQTSEGKPYQAQQFGRPCPQPTYTALPVAETAGVEEPKESPHDEDCLKLNIWMPAGPAPEGGFPVYLWMHGYGASMAAADDQGLVSDRRSELRS